MAAGEYVSVSSQADTEGADLARERAELATQPAAEEAELAGIYVHRGLEPELARTVAQQLMAHDALGAHARDELGLSETLDRPPPAGRRRVGRDVRRAERHCRSCPRRSRRRPGSCLAVSGVSLVCLAALGAIAARAGGASAVDRRRARRVLGRARDGGHRGRGRAVRHGGVLTRYAAKGSRTSRNGNFRKSASRV